MTTRMSFDHQDGDAEFVANVEHEAGDVPGLFPVHAETISSSSSSFGSQRARGELHLFLLPVGQLPDDRIADLLDLQKFYDFLHLLARGDLLGAGATEEQRGLQHARFHMDMAADEDVVDDRAVPNRARFWKVRPMPSAAKREGRSSVMSAFEQNVPAGRSQHAADEIEERRLPAPFGPITLQISRRATSKLTSETAQAAEGARYGVEAEQRRGHDSHLLRRL